MPRTKKYIQLPNDYLSYSQMSLWLSSPKRYADQYFDRREELRYTNPGQEFGKIVATALEEGSETGEVVTDTAMSLLPKYDTADVAMNTELQTPHGWLKLIGKPDTFDSLTHAFREYKTGKVAWTQKKAQNHPQMKFYAICIWLLYGTRNEQAYLDWIETESTLVDSVPVTRPTGRIESYLVTFTQADLVAFRELMITVALEIELAYAAWIPNPELINF